MAKKKSSTEDVKKFFKEKMPPEVLEFFKKQGAKGGTIGGAKAWEKLTPEQRSARAKKAAAAKRTKKQQDSK